MSGKWRELLFSPRCACVVRVGLGALFIYAGVIKIAAPQAFADVLRAYDLLPFFLLNIVALVMPWIEVFLGVILMTPFWRGGSALLALFLFCVFFVAVSTSVWREIDVDCGCFSTKVGSNPTTWLTMLRDALLMMLGYYLLLMAYREKASR